MSWLIFTTVEYDYIINNIYLRNNHFNDGNINYNKLFCNAEQTGLYLQYRYNNHSNITMANTTFNRSNDAIISIYIRYINSFDRKSFWRENKTLN